MIKLTIPGRPIGKGRAKVYGKHGVTPERTVLYENLIKMVFQESGQSKMNGFLHMEVKAYYPIPLGKSKKNRELMEKGVIRPAVKPDLDNVAKAIMDALNGLAYSDDKNIVELQLSKYYDNNERVEIVIEDCQ